MGGGRSREHRSRARGVRPGRVQEAEEAVQAGRGSVPVDRTVCPGCGCVAPREALARPCSCGRHFVLEDAARGSAGDPALGRLVLGRFVLTAIRAFGARSTAFEALDLERSDRSIVKVVRADGEPDEARRRVEREAALLMLAASGAVPALRARGVVELAPADPALEPIVLACLAMDEAAGVSLTAAVAAGARVDLLARALLESVSHLHATGIAHGDLTPAHAFASPGGTVTLIDLGSACRLGDPPDRGDGATPAFAAPERGAGPSIGSDLYAWGRVVERIGAAGLDRKLAAAVRYATRADPAARPASASELLRALPGL